MFNLKLILLLILIPSICLSDITGKVVKVSDGDTIWVLDPKKKVKVRLLGIDAPEIKQAFGKESKMILIRLIEKQNVIVVGNNKDRYGRLIGKVLLDDRDINLEMIKAGAAWHYKKYQTDQLKADRILYSIQEQLAQKTKRGLWKKSDPLAPWQWRAKRQH